MKSNISIIFWLKLFCIALLVLSFAKLPYGYYTFLRLIVTGTAIYSAYTYYMKENKVWMVFFSLIAILFNPIIPIYLSKKIWSVIDLITIIVLMVSLLLLKEYRLLRGNRD